MLERIITAKKAEVEILKQLLRGETPHPHPLRFNPFACLQDSSGRVVVIAEIKKASPIKGVLRQGLHPLKMASLYKNHGARAISYITDEKFFQGEKHLLPTVRQTAGIPVLRKDFIVDEVQLRESLLLEADIVLLIAALHDYPRLLQLVEEAHRLNLEVLLEVHTREELARVADLPVCMVGVNNRNLMDFTVDLENSLRLGEYLPSSCLHVSESGIHSAREMHLLEEHGFQAALVGETLVAASQPAAKLTELVNYWEVE
jgi:indole-3-glycerol phosphate synthase